MSKYAGGRKILEFKRNWWNNKGRQNGKWTNNKKSKLYVYTLKKSIKVISLYLDWYKIENTSYEGQEKKIIIKQYIH